MGNAGSSSKSPDPIAVPEAKGDLGPGVHVTPNVRLVERLSEGAMGSVWSADHLTLNTRVAVKFVSQALDPSDAEVLERFKREASTAAQIKSPHVVQTFDQGVMGDGTPYIVMEFLEGESLGDRLEREGLVSLRDAGLIMAQAGRALARAHQLGIVHRDIKPDNIFLTEGDVGLFCKVLDFGIAKHTRQSHMRGSTEDGALVGTPEFMSPEQLMGSQAVDYRADLWALAVVAYCCVTGMLPFGGPSVGELCVSILSAGFELPSELRDDVPAELDQWFLRALAKDPAKRFASAKEMTMAFVRVLSNIPDSSDLDVDSGQFLLPLESWEASSPEVLDSDGSPPGQPPAPGLVGTEAQGAAAVPSVFPSLDGEADAAAPRKRTLPRTGIAAVAAGTGLALGVVLATLLYTADNGDDQLPNADVPLHAAGETASARAGADGLSSEGAEAEGASASTTAGDASAPDSGAPKRHWHPRRRSSTKPKTGHEALGF